MVEDKGEYIDTVDFTIGDPKTEWTTSDGKEHTWKDIWKYAGSKNFIKNVSEFKTVRVYENCLEADNPTYLLKKKQNFKYIGNRNGKRVVEITFDPSDDIGDSLTAFETDNDREEKKEIAKTKKRRGKTSKALKTKKHYKEEEERDREEAWEEADRSVTCGERK